MIKSKVTVIGNVTRSADIKNGRDGQPFITFGMRVRLEDGEASAEIDISVAYDGEDEDVLFTNKGDRVKVQGVMTFKKMGDTTYYNLSAEKVGKAGDGDPWDARLQGCYSTPGQEGRIPPLRCVQRGEGRR